MSDYRIKELKRENLRDAQDIIDHDIIDMFLTRRDMDGIMAVSEKEGRSLALGVLIFRVYEIKHEKSKYHGCELKYLYVRDAYRHEGIAITLMNILRKLISNSKISFIEAAFPVCPQFMGLDDFLNGYGFKTNIEVDNTLRFSLNDFKIPSDLPELKNGVIKSLADLGAEGFRKYLSVLLSAMDETDYDPQIKNYDHSYFMADASFCYIKKESDSPLTFLLLHKKPSGVISAKTIYSETNGEILLKMMEDAKKILAQKDTHAELIMESLDNVIFEFINKHLKTPQSLAVVRMYMGM